MNSQMLLRLGLGAVPTLLLQLFYKLDSVRNLFLRMFMGRMHESSVEAC